MRDFSAAVLKDERQMLTSPFRIKKHDLEWLLPLSGGVAFLLSSDTRNMTERLHTNPPTISESSSVSNAGLFALALAPAGLYWWGWRHDDSYTRETALLSVRATIDSLLTTELIGAVARRERPAVDNASGHFATGNFWNSSFPSHHAAVAWSLASVIAERYPGWMTQLGSYGIATAVSLSRVSGRQHFPSDVAVGSALGFLTGRYVAHQNHERGSREPLLATANEAVASSAPSVTSGTGQQTPLQGSSYVPADSWVYPALDRLAALGLIPSQISGMRPWTRRECLRQAREAQQRLEDSDAGLADSVHSEARQLVNGLLAEFPEGPAAPSIVLDSTYVRNGVIAGPLLNDSYHFGQTWANDLGRPFGRGWNSDTGFITRAESGRLFVFVRGEYQHAPGAEPYSLKTRELIASLDDNPLQPAKLNTATNRFRTIEAYAGVRIGNFDISLGKQSLYWGPTYDAPFSFSNNAEPTKNLKISTVSPIRLPSILRYLGEVRAEAVLGKLGGQMYTWRPWFNGAKISFKLTENLEIGLTRWSVFWGVGHPETLGSLLNNLTSTNSPRGSAGIGSSDPGDRKAGFDFRYRVPGLRNWLTIYTDSYSDDDPSPLAAPRRAAINPGIYLSHLPGLPKLDFRVEAPATTPFNGDHGGTFLYYNDSYHMSNTNYGYLLGSPVGRDGRAAEAWSRYWFSARDKLQLGYRQFKGSAYFVPGGITQTDATLQDTFDLSKNLYATVSLQYERFFIPALYSLPKHNVSATLQLTWEPNSDLLKEIFVRPEKKQN
ncbi:MAG: phosphatase PAP2 family protein [Acidobacteriaceae bacterium]|nr:phosphatase PAP2 family protein [Acidobacteriaceae bacterium]